MNRENKRTFGYGFDFWVYGVGHIPDSISSGNGVNSFGKLMYRYHQYDAYNSFAFPVCDGMGIWYDILSSANEEAGTIFLKEVSCKKEHFFTPPWRNTSEILDIRNIVVDTDYQSDLGDLLGVLIRVSPLRKLYVQIRCQGLEQNNMIGMLTVGQFLHLMEEDKLLGNMIYVIYDPLFQ